MKISENVRVGFTVDGSVEIKEYDEYTGKMNKVFLNADELKKINQMWKTHIIKEVLKEGE